MAMDTAGTRHEMDLLADEVSRMALPQAVPATRKKPSSLAAAFKGVAGIIEYGAYTGVLLAGLAIVADDQRQKGPSPFAREQILQAYQALEQRIPGLR